MMLLIRHALVDAHGLFLPGRMPGIHLNEEGRRQAAALGTALRQLPLAAVYSSPLEQALETAEALADRPGHVTIVDELNEIDFGQWTGLPYAELDRQYRLGRVHAPPRTEPDSRRRVDAQRPDARLARDRPAASRHHGAAIAVVSHRDVLRSIMAKVLDVPLDRLDAFRIDPASVSSLEWTSTASRSPR